MKTIIITILALALLSSLCDAQSKRDTIIARNTKYVVTDSVFRRGSMMYKGQDIVTGRWAWILKQSIK